MLYWAECGRILTAFLLGKTVERVVTLTELTDEAGEREDGRLTGDHATVGIDVSDGDLDGSVVLGLDDAASGSALSGDVKVNKVSLSNVSVRNVGTRKGQLLLERASWVVGKLASGDKAWRRLSSLFRTRIGADSIMSK